MLKVCKQAFLCVNCFYYATSWVTTSLYFEVFVEFFVLFTQVFCEIFKYFNVFLVVGVRSTGVFFGFVAFAFPSRFWAESLALLPLTRR